MSTSTNKKRQDTGLFVGCMLPTRSIQSFAGSFYKLEELDKPHILVFISMYCSYCIDLLPHLSNIQQDHNDHQLMLFSTGDDEDHKDMIEYFKWDFPVFHMDQDEMENLFDITLMPFLLVTNQRNVRHKGVAYNADDVTKLITSI